MLGEDADLRAGSSYSPLVAARRALYGAITMVKRVAGAGTLAIRLLAAGTLLVVGLPLLTVLLYSAGYPATPVPRPIVLLADALQILIVAYALLVGAQLVAYAGALVVRFGRSGSRPAGAPGDRAPAVESRTASVSPTGGWVMLREGAVRLADAIWRQEERGRPEFGPAVLAYVRDAVVADVEHRRRAAALQRRAAELEAWIDQDSVVASERI